MNLQIISMTVLTIATLAFACVIVVLIGIDGQMAVGLGAGLFTGLGLTLLSGRGLTRALKHTNKGALVVHMYGSFLLRLMLLVAGFGALAVSGAGNPVGFAVAFLAGTVLMLLRQVMVLSTERVAPASGT